MPRQKKTYRKGTQTFPDEFPRSIERLKDATGLTWRELAYRLGTNPLTLRRWRAGARPNSQHLLALLSLAQETGLSHLLPFSETASQDQ